MRFRGGFCVNKIRPQVLAARAAHCYTSGVVGCGAI